MPETSGDQRRRHGSMPETSVDRRRGRGSQVRVRIRLTTQTWIQGLRVGRPTRARCEARESWLSPGDLHVVDSCWSPVASGRLPWLHVRRATRSCRDPWIHVQDMTRERSRRMDPRARRRSPAVAALAPMSWPAVVSDRAPRPHRCRPGRPTAHDPDLGLTQYAIARDQPGAIPAPAPALPARVDTRARGGRGCRPRRATRP
jgi:hypothetical protein